MSQPTVPTPPVWPFPIWNGTQWLMPLEQMTPSQRKQFLRSEKKDSRTPDLSDLPDARF